MSKLCSIVINLSVLHNYFDGPTKLFSDLYLTKFLESFLFQNHSFRTKNKET